MLVEARPNLSDFPPNSALVYFGAILHPRGLVYCSRTRPHFHRDAHVFQEEWLRIYWKCSVSP